MAIPLESLFALYELTEEEQLQGSILTIAQKQVIQNRLHQVCTEKLLLNVPASCPADFIQADAYKRGELETLRYILELSSSSEAEVIFRNTP